MNANVLLGGGVVMELMGVALGVMGSTPAPYFAGGLVLLCIGMATLL